MKVLFKKIKYGDDKDTILAVCVDYKFGDYYKILDLTKVTMFRDKEYLQRQTCNATPKEYLSLLTKLKKEYKEIEIVNSLKVK